MRIFLSCIFSLSVLFAKDLIIAHPVNVGKLNPHLYSPNEMFAQILSYESLVRYNNGKK